MTKEEKRRLEQEYWKSLHDENGNLVSVSKGKSQSINEYYRMNFPPKIADEMIKEYNESSFERNYSKNLSEIDEIGYEDLKHIRYEDI